VGSNPARPGPVSSPSESREFRREDLEPLAAQAGLTAASSYRGTRALAIIDGGDGAMGARLVAALRDAFPGAALWPLGLNEVAHTAMLASLGQAEPEVPDDAFDRVAGILAPSDVFIPGALDGQVTADLVEALARTNARIMLLPPRDERLRWVAAPKWPVERWVENAVVEAGNVLNADE
jgi:hypothetical protein